MKTKTIKMQIVKNLGNYESVRFEVEIDLEEQSTMEGFERARLELDSAYNELYVKKQLDYSDDEKSLYQRVLRSAKIKKVKMEEVLKYYHFTDVAGLKSFTQELIDSNNIDSDLEPLKD